MFFSERLPDVLRYLLGRGRGKKETLCVVNQLLLTD
jgi:hypothetical protein